MSVSPHIRFASLLIVALCALVCATGCKTGSATGDDEALAEQDEAEGYLDDARKALEDGEFEQVETMLELAEEADADASEVAEIRGRYFRRRALDAVDREDHDAVYEWSLRAAEVEPLDGKRFEDLMRALRAGEVLGKPPATLADLADRATEIVMASRSAHEMAARFWDDAGQPEKALPHYQWLHKVSPDDTGVTVRLASIYARVGEVRRAERLLEKVREENPENVQAALKLATLYEKTDRIARARALYESLIDAFPDNSGLYFRFARFLDRIGEGRRAEDMREKAQEKLPGVERRDMRRLR